MLPGMASIGGRQISEEGPHFAALLVVPRLAKTRFEVFRGSVAGACLAQGSNHGWVFRGCRRGPVVGGTKSAGVQSHLPVWGIFPSGLTHPKQDLFFDGGGSGPLGLRGGHISVAQGGVLCPALDFGAFGAKSRVKMRWVHSPEKEKVGRAASSGGKKRGHKNRAGPSCSLKTSSKAGFFYPKKAASCLARWICY